MELKKWHLYTIVTLCFILAFVAINKKYDRFYRVNGINNDNRALIEQYLDEQQQQYLVDNAIAVDKFIDYISVPKFYLPYYEYYNVLNKAKVFSNVEELVNKGNSVASRLESMHGQKALSYCKSLISYNLVHAFLNQEEFNFENIEYYQLIRTLYDEDEYSYVQDTNTYIDVLYEDGVSQVYDTLKTMCNNYDKNSLKTLLTTPLEDGMAREYDPQKLGTVVNQGSFIGNYEPKHLVTVSNIPRNVYSMYLQKDAYEALLLMYTDVEAVYGSVLVLTKGYRSYDMLALQEPTLYETPGSNEYQLGTTVHLKQSTYVADFTQTELYQWLNENSYKYGYILRYPQGKEEISGHEFSSRIFRYVGIDLATILHDQNITLEEYHTQDTQ